MQERADREPKRRSRIVQVFPSRKLPIRQDDGGCVLGDGRGLSGSPPVQRRLHRQGAVEGAKVKAPKHAYEGAAAEHAARIIAPVVADNPIPDGKVCVTCARMTTL